MFLYTFSVETFNHAVLTSIAFKMDDVEMECNDPSEEGVRTMENATFKTPKIVDPFKLHPYSMCDSSGYMSASSPEMNSTSGSLPCHTRMTRRISNDSQLSASPESSFRANIQQSIGASPDSGFDSEGLCGSVGSAKSSVSLDLDIDLSIPLGPRMKRPAAPDVPQVWQSTPVDTYSKPKRVTAADVMQQSPSKRRRPLVKRASRDLFQSRQKDSIPFFSEDFLGASNTKRPSFAGRETVDFLYYLGKQSIQSPAIESIVGYLSPADLCRASLVSRSWKSIVENLPTAARRKQDYVDSCVQVKENMSQSGKKTGATLPFRGQLVEVQNFSIPEEMATQEPRSPPVSPSKVRFNLFLKEGRKLECGQTLVQCPQCKLPARKEAERAARCTRRGCQFYFCVLCLCKFHEGNNCPVSAVKHRKRQAAIGSRESRRNLLRLCK